MSSPPNRFLQLPIELRIMIYGFAIIDEADITIGSTSRIGTYNDAIDDHDYSPYPGIPKSHKAAVTVGYSAAALSSIEAYRLDACPEEVPASTRRFANPELAHRSLLLTNKQTHLELMKYFPTPPSRRVNLYVQYPHGLHVLSTSMPELAGHAKTIHLAGVYVPRTYSPEHRARIPPAVPPQQGRDVSSGLEGVILPDSAAQLARLIEGQSQHLDLLELRIFYPNPDSYRTVFADHDSAISIALQMVGLASVVVETWRTSTGTGIVLKATRGEENTRRVDSVFRTMQQQGGNPNIGESWIVDPLWPHSD